MNRRRRQHIEAIEAQLRRWGGALDLVSWDQFQDLMCSYGRMDGYYEGLEWGVIGSTARSRVARERLGAAQFFGFVDSHERPLNWRVNVRDR